MTSKWTIQGVTDEVDTCECCGRTDLTKAVALVDAEGTECFMGVVCAAAALQLPAPDVRVQARKAQDRADALKRARAQRKADLEMAEWVGFLVARTGTANIMEACAKLGGFSAARAAFAAVQK